MSTEKIQPGLVIAGRYRVVKQLGEGGVGAVYLVQHVHTDERLALKVLHNETLSDPSTIERFRTEARAPARIDSDHIVRVTDADVAPELNGAPFLVMEFLRGKDLSGEAEARQKLHPKEVVLYLRQAARALDKAHAIGIVHRDLKPENIFLTVREDGTPCVKLLDFGIAKLTGAASSAMGAHSKTKTGAVFGTPLYMAPEQARAQAQLIGPHTDVWAIGLIAARLLLGFDYWQAETISDLVVQIVVDPIPPPSQKGSPFGAAFDAWFLRCCSRDASQRFRTAGETITQLAAALGVVEGPALVLEVTEILQQARAAEGAPTNTVAGAPMPIAPQPENPRALTPMGGDAISPQTAMGATVLAASTAVPVAQTGRPPNASSSKAPIFAAIAIALIGIVGAAVMFGAKNSGQDPKPEAAAAEAAPLPLPTPTPKAPVAADPQALVEPAAAVSVEPAAALPAVSAKPAAPPLPPGPGRTKPVPTVTTKKKPNDDDLMSGRR
ncbi:serine/threonine protein kinase [Polyangium jinanense]|uniref:Serine/threonine protein kinase n=1 Tax=Polyangium jinanense TaxID=2829994 RepID=A0A9X3X3K2_9BACT|nr:serine/threonine-protein kinase [Polyangium jinanense]MDC3954498.1 serine/threonine protein kinase [Polyangium jinanense]MDC3980801.1 serine/threonine protein kinase [Polyangium jinanense]